MTMAAYTRNLFSITLTRLKNLSRRWAYLLVLVPIITDWLDTGHLPLQPREYITEVIVGILLGVCVWLLYKESDQLRQMSVTDHYFRYVENSG